MSHNQRSAQQARRLAQLLVAPAVAADCNKCLDELEAYVEAQLSSGDHLARMPEVARHLDLCVSCAESYALLYEARLAEEALLPAEQVPRPDLSFLPQPERPAPASGTRLRELLAQAVTRSQKLLRLSLSQALLDALRDLAGPTTLAPVLRSADNLTPVAEIELFEPGAEIERLRLLAYRQQSTSDRCTLRISVNLQGRDWPDLAGVAVRIQLTDGEQERLVVTDAWGEAVIEDVPLTALPELQLTVDAGDLSPER